MRTCNIGLTFCPGGDSSGCRQGERHCRSRTEGCPPHRCWRCPRLKSIAFVSPLPKEFP